MIVASVASDVVGWFLIVIGLVGVAAGIVAAVIAAVREALAAVLAAQAQGGTVAVQADIPWKEIFELLKELAKTKAGLALILGLVSIAAGAIVLHYRWF
jgi:hypothetical protein